MEWWWNQRGSIMLISRAHLCLHIASRCTSSDMVPSGSSEDFSGSTAVLPFGCEQAMEDGNGNVRGH